MRRLFGQVVLAGILVVGLLLWRQAATGNATTLENAPGTAALAPVQDPVDPVVEWAHLPELHDAPTAFSTREAVGLEPSTPGEAVESELPAGECSFVVRRLGDDPRGVRVTIGLGLGPFMGGDFLPGKSLTRAMEWKSGLEGQVEFPGLAHGTWSVEVLDAEGRRRRAYHNFKGEDMSKELVLDLGDCAVEGTAWNDEGTPWPGVTVRLSIESKDESTGTSSLWRGWTATDEFGHYVLDGFQPGYGWMAADTELDLEVSMSGEGKLMNAAFAFSDDRQRTVNFGSALGTAEIQLTVSDASGRRLPDGQVQLFRRTTVPGGLGKYPDLFGNLNDEGEVILKASPGIYMIKVTGWPGSYGSIADIDVLSFGVFQVDRQLETGHSIFGELVGPDGEPHGDDAHERQVALRSGPSLDSEMIARTPLRPAGKFSFHALQPGDYYLTTGQEDAFLSIPVSLPDGDPVAIDVIFQSLD